MKSSTIDHRVDAAPERIDIINSWVETFSVSTFVDCIEKCVNVGKLSLIGNHNVNSLTLLRASDLFCPNEREAERLTGESDPESMLGWMGDQPPNPLQSL